MPQVVFTANLQRYVDCPSKQAHGTTVRETLEAVFREVPRLRDYILDDQSILRHHVIVFLDGELVRDRIGLSDPVKETSEIYVMQALSGGCS